VTTDERDSNGNVITDAALQDRGTRVAVGGSSLDWYGYSAGGVAYVNAWGKPYYAPAFVFVKELGGGATTKPLAEAISHEVGHTLGLSHDGLWVSSNSYMPYYQGHNLWAPIMGVGYYKEMTQWSKGEYANATVTEDDLAVMTDASKQVGGWWCI